jgi:hypothetical protein
MEGCSGGKGWGLGRKSLVTIPTHLYLTNSTLVLGCQESFAIGGRTPAMILIRIGFGWGPSGELQRLLGIIELHIMVEFFLGGDGFMGFRGFVGVEVVFGKVHVELVEVLEGEIVGGLLQLVFEFRLSLEVFVFANHPLLCLWELGSLEMHGEFIQVIVVGVSEIRVVEMRSEELGGEFVVAAGLHASGAMVGVIGNVLHVT